MKKYKIDSCLVGPKGKERSGSDKGGGCGNCYFSQLQVSLINIRVHDNLVQHPSNDKSITIGSLQIKKKFEIF